MKRSGQIHYLPLQVIPILLLIIVFSCKKDKDEPDSLNGQRIVEILDVSSGIEDYKYHYNYTEGRMSSLYSYTYNEKGEWENESRSEFEYEPNSLSHTEFTYSWRDNSWKLSGKTEVIYSGNDLIEYTWSGQAIQNQWEPFIKWIWTYDNSRPQTCICYQKEDNLLEESNKEEYLYNDGKVYMKNLYLYKDGEWELRRQMTVDYKDHLIDEINDYRLENDDWVIDYRYAYEYDNLFVTEIQCYSTFFMGDTLGLDYTIEYQYNDQGNVSKDTYISQWSSYETYYTYEAGAGNYWQTVAAVSKALNFPIDWPRAVKDLHPRAPKILNHGYHRANSL